MAFVRVIFFTCVISCALQFSFSAPSVTTEAITEINQSVTDTSKKVVGTVSEGINKKLSIEGAALKGLAGIITTSTNNILDGADKGIKTATDLGKNGVQVPTTVLSDTLTGSGSTFQSAGKLALGLGENFKSGIDKSTSFAAKKKTEAVSKSSDLVSQVKSDVKETAQSATSKVEEAVDKTNNLAAQTEKEVKNAAQTANSKIEASLDKASSAISEKESEIKEGVKKGVSNVEANLEKASSENTISQVKSLTTEGTVTTAVKTA